MQFLLYALLSTSAAQEPEPVQPPHPGFTLPTVDGGSGTLADHLGSRTVVIHFASW